MTKKLAKILDELCQSGQTESQAVAGCLCDIASNNGKQKTDQWLLMCAEEIRDVAQSIIDRMQPKKKEGT